MRWSFRDPGRLSHQARGDERGQLAMGPNSPGVGAHPTQPAAQNRDFWRQTPDLWTVLLYLPHIWTKLKGHTPRFHIILIKATLTA
jgi:hypothetical protein